MEFNIILRIIGIVVRFKYLVGWRGGFIFIYILIRLFLGYVYNEVMKGDRW